MTATEAIEPEVKKPSKLPLIIGVVLALAGGGGGFYAANAGLLPFLDGGGHEQVSDSHVGAKSGGVASAHETTDLDAAFVPMEPLLISLGPNANARHLRFRGQIETTKEHAAEVQMMMPRIIDVLNSYLRAVAEQDLQEPAALVRLRAQMLRRVQIVLGPGRVRDLLVMEFVLN